MRWVRRPTVVLALLGPQVPMAVVCERWGRSPSCLYAWQKAWRLRGLASLVAQHGGGRPEPWTPRQKKRLVEVSAAGPLVVGLEPACWTSVRIRVLLWREGGVRDQRHSGAPFLPNLGFSLHKARLVSAPLDAAQRLAWLPAKWPAMFRAAKRRGGLSLCAAEASGAQWGSRSDTWARRGQQPEGPPSGKRTGDTVCGALASFSGRRFSQGLEGRFHAEQYHTCWRMRRAQTAEHLFVIQAGARDHTSASTQAVLAAHSDRSTAEPLPSYAPDDNPIASLWKKPTQRATHHQYFKEFAALTISVEKARAYCAMHPEEV